MQRQESGAVSIFVVIFAALLITVVTVSFIRIMINDQQQATNNDLSQSAYDSAQAGVEDAKRALLRYRTICSNDGEAVCNQLSGQLSTNVCNAAVRIGDVVGSDSEGAAQPSAVGEIRVQQSVSSTDDALEQAYTCVTIAMDTPDYIGSVAVNQSKLVPLRSVDPFDRVAIEWFSADDLTSGGPSTVSLLGPGPAPKPLLTQASWPVNRPPLLRTQLMQFGTDFTLENFDIAANNQSNTNTVFLYPTSDNAANTQTSLIARDTRKNNATAQTPPDVALDTPLPVRCQASLNSGGYSCRLELTLPSVMGGGDRTAYLRLTPFYNATHFRVSLFNGGSSVDFDGVQPEVDSTGRANDIFRRISSRVDLIDTSFPYPEAALDVTGNLCKDFAVTDTAYYAGTCTP